MKSFTTDKNLFFSILLVLIAAAILLRITPPSVDPVLKLVISKNRTSITSIHQSRSIEATKEVMVDVLNLAEQNRFKHPKLGDIGFANDFFVDIETSFIVNQNGRYRFTVASDDGFSLAIDNRQICEFTGSRPLNNQVCNVSLNEGTHSFKLAYYQGYGNAGLKVQYTQVGDNKTYWVGENSPAVEFQ